MNRQQTVGNVGSMDSSTNQFPAPPSASSAPIWARRERLMRRHRTLTFDAPTPPEAGSFEADRVSMNGAEPTMTKRHNGLRLQPSSHFRPGTPPPMQLATPATISQPPYSAHCLFPVNVEMDSRFLMPPVDLRMTAGEAPPHRKDTVEKIPIRARSQSWLIRTRHLLDDDKLHRRTPMLAKCLYVLSILLVILTFPFSIPFCIRIAKEYERAVVFRLGRLIKQGTKGPGMFFILPCVDSYRMVDLRVLSFDVPPQEILSRDSVTVSVEAVIYFRISNPVISVTNVNDAQFSTKLLAQTTLRNVLGTKTLSEILMERDNISQITEKVLDDGTDPWGVKVERVEIKDIRLPHQLMRSMATEAEAARNAKARVIACDGERNASRSLVEAADVIKQNRVSLQLRYLQTLSSVASVNNKTIVVPIPVEVARGVMRRIKAWRKQTAQS